MVDLVVPAGAIVTPLAHDLAVDSKIEIRVEGAPEANRGAAPDPEDGGPAPLAEGGAVAIGSDHGGFELKHLLRGQPADSIDSNSSFMNPGWANVPTVRSLYRQFDVSTMIVAGTNVLGVRLGQCKYGYQ